MITTTTLTYIVGNSGGGISTFSLLALLVSIFNIISLIANSSTNNNNNDNNNNINDNQGNNNGGQNSESNTNNEIMAVTQVMQVPPGAGRRKRSNYMPKTEQQYSTLLLENSKLILKPPNTTAIIQKIPQNVKQTFLDEIAIGITMSLNGWYYIELGNLGKPLLTHRSCIFRNLCEMNYNCAVFGPGAKMVCSFATHVIARDLARTDDEETELLFAADNGSLMTRSCESQYKRGCPAPYWRKYTNMIRKSVHYDIGKKL